jgi:tetratricopeptide (TPR) repeat protein
MTANNLKLLTISKKNSIFAIIGIIVFVIIVVSLVRKPAQSPLRITPVDNQTQEENVNNNATMVEAKRLEALVNSYPDSIEAILSLAHLYQDVGMSEKAIHLYSRYLEKDPKNADARIDFGVCYFQLSGEDTLEKGTLLKKAIDEMELALKYVPNHQMGHFNLGIVNLQSGNINKAVEYFKKCISLNPKSTIAQKAQQILDQHINNQPNNPRKDK